MSVRVSLCPPKPGRLRVLSVARGLHAAGYGWLGYRPTGPAGWWEGRLSFSKVGGQWWGVTVSDCVTVPSLQSSTGAAAKLRIRPSGRIRNIRQGCLLTNQAGTTWLTGDSLIGRLDATSSGLKAGHWDDRRTVTTCRCHRRPRSLKVCQNQQHTAGPTAATRRDGSGSGTGRDGAGHGCARLMSHESNLTRLWLKWVESGSNHADRHLRSTGYWILFESKLSQCFFFWTENVNIFHLSVALQGENQLTATFDRTPLLDHGQQLLAKVGKMWWVVSQIRLNSDSDECVGVESG